MPRPEGGFRGERKRRRAGQDEREGEHTRVAVVEEDLAGGRLRNHNARGCERWIERSRTGRPGRGLRGGGQCLPLQDRENAP
ncbi:MAG: hypothetical protein BWY63_03401 [Chloroflexi bacterium ADurb.Bin360]|nr:MAG: hypothetical protein BWY63_03401 [Chloroflexi bacterium ADurb.Bin360]